MTFQSTLPVWGATIVTTNRFIGVTISIHAPRVGSDFILLRSLHRKKISIHAPRVGSDTGKY